MEVVFGMYGKHHILKGVPTYMYVYVVYLQLCVKTLLPFCHLLIANNLLAHTIHSPV